MYKTFERIIDPVTTAIRRETSAAIAKLHRHDFSKSVNSNTGGGSSLYMQELTDKLSFIKSEIMARYNVGDYGPTWFGNLT
jgi:conserved oligomeric Golgi complex subunit 5